MAKKFYAVRNGYKNGIFETWDECKAQVIGFSGAVYKSFPTLNEAKQYMEIGTKKEVEDELYKQAPSNSVNIDSCQAVAYVDGSYDLKTKRFSCGVVMFHAGDEQHLSESFDDAELAEMRNVAGEIKGAERAMQYCLEREIKSLSIHHDYEGVAKWCTGEWQARKTGTKAYKTFYNLASEKMQIKFIKVKAHSGDKYNELADQLAKKALGII
jgi:ribonuclease HI